MTTHIYGYFEDINDFKISTIKQWEKVMTPTSAKRYLKEHLLKSLEDDFMVANSALKEKNVGYFASPRIIFPYITFLGSLYCGEDKSISAIKFMVDYMGRVSNEYEYCSGIYYLGYRNGLIHTNMPKIFYYGKKRLGWWISHAEAIGLNRGDHLNGNKILYPELFFKDLKKAIHFYIADFDDPLRGKTLFSNFKKGFIEMSKIHQINDIQAGKEVKKYLRKGLKRYGL